MKTRLILPLISFVITTLLVGQQPLKNPSFEEVLSLQGLGDASISHNGRHVVYTVWKPDWEKNSYNSEIWLSKDGSSPFQLTRTKDGSSSDPQWTPDDQYITFTSSREDKTQLFAIRIDGGEAFPVTNIEEGIQQYEWMPDGKSIVFTSSQGESKEDKTRKERYGAFTEDDAEYKFSWLYSVEIDLNMGETSDLPCYEDNDSTYQTWDCIKFPEPTPLIDSVDFTIRGFSISPDGKQMVFTHSPDPLIMSFMDTDISLYTFSDSTYEIVIQNPGSDFAGGWSPDSKSFLYTSDLDNRTSNFYKNNNAFSYRISDGSSTRLAADFDENISLREWNTSGIYFTANQRTQTHLFRLDPNTNQYQRVSGVPQQFGGLSFSNDGKKMAFSATNQDDLYELYISSVENIQPQKISDFTSQIDQWKVAQSEVVTWKSEDGTMIEGVVHKPMDFDDSKKYPLLVVIHGGPTGVDRPAPILSYVYPVNQWLNKGAVVLRVNYRGSAGYGEAFRSLNVENLGVGDAWDVLSGVDHMIDQGYIDAERMGCMGWSQGGYISAFLTTTSDRFKAISVGAGISNWMTYYVNTDIHPFTRQYLKATPWQNEEIYKKTSPMTYIKKASTPTLIQHGENDRRVPIPNAYELLQGLRDVGVPAKLMVYKGFGHGISKPKERLAAIWHNWQWFNKYLWNEDVEIPLGE